MAIEVWWVGKTKMTYLNEGLEDFERRIKRFHPFKIRVIKGSKAKRRSDQIEQEGRLILKELRRGERLYLLDPQGKANTSVQFATFLKGLIHQQGGKIIFAIGGAYGFSDMVKATSKGMLSLSPMTFTHDIVRLIFLEQLYRAFTINNNLPYHH